VAGLRVQRADRRLDAAVGVTATRASRAAIPDTMARVASRDASSHTITSSTRAWRAPTASASRTLASIDAASL